MSLPLLISVPHAGIQIPSEVEKLNLLTVDQIIKDGDEGAREIFDLRDEVAAFVTTDIARAYLDMNRPEDDRSSDGVVKTETIYQEPIFNRPLQEKQIHQLLFRYYYPYHRSLSRTAGPVLLGIDCHTMAEIAPPISPDAGTTRPHICLSDADGVCPKEWTSLMGECLESEFNCTVSINHPFNGGFIIRSHAAEFPWLQLELSRADFMSITEKRLKVLAALQNWCKRAESKNTPRKD
jgi:formiminoglutamase